MSLATALLTPILGDASPWSPQRLFVTGDAGAWYDPSDLTAEKVAWRRNLLRWSEDFTNAAWNKLNITVTANAIAAPDGTLTADKLEATATAATNNTQTATATSSQATYSFYGKQGSGATDGNRFILRNNTTAVNLSVFTVDWSTGAVSLLGSGTATSENVGSGWWRIVLSVGTGITQGNQLQVYTAFNGNSETAGEFSYIWGVQLEAGLTATAYQRITDFTSDFLAAFPTHALYQEPAGTTPVTALGQQVGLVIDKSRGGLANLGAELVTNGDFSGGTTGWLGFVANIAVSSGRLQVTPTDASSRSGYQLVTTAIGRLYSVTAQYDQGTTTGVLFRVRNNAPNGVIVRTSSTFTGTGSTQFYFIAGSTSSAIELAIAAGNSGNSAFFDNVTIREVPGTHLIQPTSASRPLLDARVNLLTRTEQFDDAAWTKVNSPTVTANSTIAPDGTTTADTLIGNAGLTSYITQNVSVAAGAEMRAIFHLYQGTSTTFRLRYFNTAVTVEHAGVVVGWSGGVPSTTSTTGTWTVAPTYTALGGGWYRMEGQFNVGAQTSVLTLVYPSNSVGTTTTVIWGADVRLATNAAYPYQRVTTATDYADVGVPRALLHDGFDDSAYTASTLDLSSTDEVTVCAGVYKNSDATQGAVVEHTATIASNNGAFLLAAPDANTTATFGWDSKGTAQVDAVATSVAAPITRVVTGLADISADVCTLRLNAAQADTDTGDQGTGNYANAVLYVGRRNNASLPFNGKLYPTVIVGRVLDAATLAQLERYIAARTGVTL